MSRRTGLLLAVLLGVAGLGAWNQISVRRAPETAAPSSDETAAADAEPVPEPPPTDPSALTLEKYPGPVADSAGVLGHFGDTLEWLAKSWREDLGVDVHMVTLAAPDLPVEQLAPRIFELRKVGESAPTGGFLVLLNPARNEARIEVSYTLEPVLPDALVGRIAADQLAPYAAYRFAGMAVMDAVHFLKDFTLQQAIEGKLALDESFRTRPAYVERTRFLSGGGGAQVRVPSAQEIATRDFEAKVEGAQRKRYAPAREPLASAEAFLRMQRDLVGDPTMELLTEGSQCLRRGYPLAPYEEIERARRLEAAKPWRAIVSGDRAVVTSDDPPHGFVPVLLQQVDGLWRVDLVETWKNLFFGQNGDYWLNNSDNPYTFGLAAFGSGTPRELEAWNLGGNSIEKTIATLKARSGPLSEFLLAEVLFRNCFRSVEAMVHYEKASDAAPGGYLFHETLAQRAEYLGARDLAIDAYERMNDYAALEIARLHARQENFGAAVQAAKRAVRRNPNDPEALTALRDYLKAAKEESKATEVEKQLATLAADPERYRPMEVTIDPPDPLLDLVEPTRVGKDPVYDHTWFSATILNPSNRPVVIDRVLLWTKGTHDASGLGDIRDYWSYPSGEHELRAGERIVLSRVWGYIRETANEQIRFVFDVCYHGEVEPMQCHATSVDSFPR